MRPGDGADDVERVLDVGHPVAHRLVERVLQRLRPGLDRHDRRAEELHAEDVLRLALDVLRAHVDDALHAEARGDRRGRDAVLAGAGLGDDARLAQALREQRLADAVVDLVRAGVVQVLALEVDLRAAELLRPAPRVVDRARPADVVLELVLELGDELGIAAVARVLARAARRARGSASRRRTRRRTGRSGRARREVVGRSAICIAHLLDERADLAGLLDALARPAVVASASTPLDTSTAHGPHVPDRRADVARREPAGQDQRRDATSVSCGGSASSRTSLRCRPACPPGWNASNSSAARIANNAPRIVANRPPGLHRHRLDVGPAESARRTPAARRRGIAADRAAPRRAPRAPRRAADRRTGRRP